MAGEVHCTPKKKKDEPKQRRRVYLQGSGSRSSSSEPDATVSSVAAMEESSVAVEAERTGRGEQLDLGAGHEEPGDRRNERMLRSGTTSLKRLKRLSGPEMSLQSKMKIRYEDRCPPRYHLRFRQQGRTLSSLQSLPADEDGRTLCVAGRSGSTPQRQKKSKGPIMEEPAMMSTSKES